jgi:hypothetical protein
VNKIQQKMTLNKLIKRVALIFSIAVVMPCLAQETEVFDPVFM